MLSDGEEDDTGNYIIIGYNPPITTILAVPEEKTDSVQEFSLV
jgi:hypothetical protein